MVNISSIRTEYGKFDYMAYLDTTWKKSQEAAMKAGYIVGYRVMVAEPRTPTDPDIYLIITYKNWAALDDALAKGDEITKAVEGSLESASKAAVDPRQDAHSAWVADSAGDVVEIAVRSVVVVILTGAHRRPATPGLMEAQGRRFSSPKKRRPNYQRWLSQRE